MGSTTFYFHTKSMVTMYPNYSIWLSNTTTDARNERKMQRNTTKAWKVSREQMQYDRKMICERDTLYISDKKEGDGRERREAQSHKSRLVGS